MAEGPPLSSEESERLVALQQSIGAVVVPSKVAPEGSGRAPLSPEESERLVALQQRIGVVFRRQELLREAMTHASWNNERGEPSGPGHDNERLEYLGDAVLELASGEYLFKRFPGYDEGHLTQLRAALVNTTSLARLSDRLEIGEALLLGRGAVKTGARQLPSLLANAFEALIGAVFLDHGFRVAVRVFIQNIGDLDAFTDENYKGKLQEVAQERAGVTPSYRVVASAGPGHRREYSADAVVGGNVVGHGRGTTKQAAEQAAAHVAVQHLTSLPDTAPERAAGAARAAARGAAKESTRVRRRVAEVAADRGARRATLVVAPVRDDTAANSPRRGLLGVLRNVAEALVGRREEPPPPPVEPGPKRPRRGHRGGRGRRRVPPPPT